MNTLIIRACAVGDFVVNLPALRALQQKHEETRFTLVGYPAILDLARDFVSVAAVFSLESQPWTRLFYEPIGPLSFDNAIVWMKDPVVADNLRLSGIGAVIHADPFPVQRHAASHLLHTLQLPVPDLPDLWKPSSARIVLHPGSGGPRKCWPHFRELAARLDSVAFLIGPAEEEFDTGRYPRMEGLSLREVIQELACSRGFVGNDSGISHLAGYLGCPTVAIFGPTDPSVWRPLGRRVQILWNPDLNAISADEVLHRVRVAQRER